MTACRLPIETEHALPNWFLVDFRKEELRKGLFSSPATVQFRYD